MPTNMIHPGWHETEARGPELALLAAGSAAVIAGVVTLWKLSAVLALPMASLVLLLVGFALALAPRQPSSGTSLSYRDAGALLVFAGFGAAMMSDAASLAYLLGGR